MARDDQSDRVAPVRAADRAARAGAADAFGDLRVGRGLAVRDRAHLVPHAPLERRALELDIQVELGALAGEVLLELDRGVRDRLRVALRGFRLAKADARECELVALQRQRSDRT